MGHIMGKEYEFKKAYLMSMNGEFIPFKGFSNMTCVEKEDSEGCIIYPPSQEDAYFNIVGYSSKKSILYLLAGPNKRTIRKALRWYEKLRRLEIKYPECRLNNKLILAANKAKFGSFVR